VFVDSYLMAWNERSPMGVRGIETLLSESYRYPEVVADQLCNLFDRSCTMLPFGERAFPDRMAEFHEYTGSWPSDTDASAESVNSDLLDRTDEVESFFAETLWSDILDPMVEGFSTELVVAPYRDTPFESAIRADYTPRWKAEAYLFTTGEASDVFETIGEAKRNYLRAHRDGVHPTAAAKDHKLTEIRVKSELFGYPECCTAQFVEERERRFDLILDIGSERIQELQRSHDNPAEVRSAFKRELESRGVSPTELNSESRIVEQLEYINVGEYFDEWSYDRLSEFYDQRSGEPLPEFFYAFFTSEFYPHHPRCEAAIAVGQRIETELERTEPELVPVYRMALMTHVFSTLGFDDHELYRRLLRDSFHDVG
jgi:hypothetical protein